VSPRGNLVSTFRATTLPCHLPPSYIYIYIYNSIKRPVDASWHCWHLVILTSRCETSLIQREIAGQNERQRKKEREREATKTFLEQPFCGPSCFGDHPLMDRATVSVHQRVVNVTERRLEINESRREVKFRNCKRSKTG